MITQVQKRKADYPIADIFLNRWSPRSFLEKEVPEELLMSVFEAARWAPSANNRQPWYFIVARTKEEKEKFYQFINEGNLQWCKKAPVLALLISKRRNENGENRYHAFDAGTCWGFLALQAVKNGLITHPMGGINREKARDLLNIPDDFDIHIVIAIGYQGEKEDLPKPFQNRELPNDRRPLKDSLFQGTFGKSF